MMRATVTRQVFISHSTADRDAAADMAELRQM